MNEEKNDFQYKKESGKINNNEVIPLNNIKYINFRLVVRL